MVLPAAAAELEAAIAAAPDVRDSYLVYGDLLEAHGDPRGQLIALGHQINKNPHHRAMLATFRAYLAEHDAALRGPLASCDDLVTDVEWFMGFIKKCRVANTFDRLERRRPRVAIPDVIGYLLDEPGPARFLQHLTVGIVDYESNDYEAVCRVIAQRTRPALRTLFLGDFESHETELNWSSIGDIGFLWPAVPNLTELILRSGRMTLGTLDLPALRKLATITGGLDATALRAIASATWPALTTLSLQIGLQREGAAADLALIEPFLTGARMPQLTSLGIMNCEIADALCARLVDAPILPRLRELDLSMSNMSDAGAAILIANHAKLAHLDRLVVEDNYLSEHACNQLAACARQVMSGGQRLDEGGPYYASAFE